MVLIKTTSLSSSNKAYLDYKINGNSGSLAHDKFNEYARRGACQLYKVSDGFILRVYV